MPEIFNVAFLERATEPGVVFGSKAVGEPPLMLAFSVREAIRDAIAAFGAAASSTLDSPATPERIYWAIESARVAKQSLRRPSHGGHSRVKILRAAIFHTPRNPFIDPNALVAYADGALAIDDGKVVASRGLQRRQEIPSRRSGSRSARRLHPARLHRHSHSLPAGPHSRRPGIRAARLAGATHAAGGSAPRGCRLRVIDRAANLSRRSPRTAPRPHWFLARTSPTPPPPCSRPRNSAGLRIFSGLVLSDRALLPELHQTPEAAYRDARSAHRSLSAVTRSLRDSRSPPRKRCSKSARLSCAKIRPCASLRTSTRTSAKSKRSRACFPGPRIISRSTSASISSGRSPSSRITFTPATASSGVWPQAGAIDRALPVQQRRARQRHLPHAAASRSERAILARHRRRRRHGLRHAERRLCSPT